MYLRYMNRFMKTIGIFVLLSSFSIGHAQVDSITKPTRIKIDGVAAVIGDYVILDSDVDKAYIDLQSQGIPTTNIERCSLLQHFQCCVSFAVYLYDNHTLTYDPSI